MIARGGSILLVLALAAATPAVAGAGSVERRASLGRGSPAAYDQAWSAVSSCDGVADCVRARFAGWAGSLAERIDGLPEARRGPGAWLRLAAFLHQGSVPIAPKVERLSLREAIEAVYAAAGYPIDARLHAAVDEQVGAMTARESEEIAELIGAFALSLRLAERAREGSGIERWMGDPRRAHKLLGSVMRRPERAKGEARELLAAVEAVDLGVMTAAALVIADALARFRPEIVRAGLDLPLIFVGGEGNTTHTEDRLLSVDVAGRDTYRNNAGGGLVPNPVPGLYPFGGSVAIDFGPDDDDYESVIGGQRFATGSVGILYDEGGSDLYHIVDAYGQGAAIAGVGVLYDVGQGDDRYLTVWEEGELTPVLTKGSGAAGIGLLVDEGGSDVFRQDGLDGVGYGAAGGFGLLASLGQGDDVVRSDGVGASNTTGVVQGNAELDALGIIYDEQGDDTYWCNGDVRQGCQGSAADSSLGLLWDRAGDDTYRSEYTTWCDLVNDDLACLFGEPGLDLPDVRPLEFPIMVLGQGAAYMAVPPNGQALAVLYDEGGDDTYVAPKWAQGYGAFGNIGLLYDTGGGDDAYMARPPLVGARGDGQTWVDGPFGVGIDE